MHFKDRTNQQTLKRIDCSEITIEGMAALMQALPNCKIANAPSCPPPTQLGWAWVGSGGLHAKAGVRPLELSVHRLNACLCSRSDAFGSGGLLFLTPSAASGHANGLQ